MVQEVFDVVALNPMAMWDLRYVIELEEQRFMESLNSMVGSGSANSLRSGKPI
jgi:hypothetical protein